MAGKRNNTVPPYQKESANRKEITGSTPSNYVKVVKLFCEMNDLIVPWKKPMRGLPKAKNHADGVPRLDELQKIMIYHDWRMKAIVCAMVSSSIRLGAWDICLIVIMTLHDYVAGLYSDLLFRDRKR